MKSWSSLLSRTVLVAVGVAGVSSVALANPPGFGMTVQYGAPRYERNYEQRRYDDEYARVLNVETLVTRVRVSNPQRECWQESREVVPAARTEVRSTLIGGLIGAAVGTHITARGHLPGPAAIIGGSLIGAAIGNNVGANRAAQRGEYEPVEQSVERCAVNYRDEWQERVDGYRVTYEFHGREYTTHMPYDPGRRMRVNVAVSPEADGYDR